MTWCLYVFFLLRYLDEYIEEVSFCVGEESAVWPDDCRMGDCIDENIDTIWFETTMDDGIEVYANSGHV